MRVFIRVDSSRIIGTGHVVRCATLAAGLRRAGAQVEFICRAHDGHASRLLERQEFPVHLLPMSSQHSPARLDDYVSWLGEGWERDAAETAEILERRGPADWLIVDHYAIDAAWECRLQQATQRIMVIDDLANRNHEANLLLDQNLVAGLNTRYVGRVASGCGLLLGPRYALLQPEYAEMRQRLPARSGAIKNVLIYFGGADHFGLTLLAAQAASDALPLETQINVVGNSQNEQWERVAQLLALRPNAFMHADLPSLAPLMARADLAIGAGGATTWERICLGLPTLVITLAENQREIAEYLHEQKLIAYLGHATDVSASTISESLRALRNDGLPREWSERCQSLVDGLGVQRVVAAMMATNAMSLVAREATSDDEGLLLEWANDPVTRRNGFSTGQISPETHHTWLQNKLSAQAGCLFMIVETSNGVPVGQVRFERGADDWEIHFSLASAFRGKSLGASMLKTALEAFRERFPQQKVFGRVKAGNAPSCRVFESLGFGKSEGSDDVVTYRINMRSLKRDAVT